MTWKSILDMTSFEKMSWFEYWKHAFLKVIRMSSKVLYQHCMLSRCVGIVFWMQKIQRNSSNGQFHCFHYVRKRAPCWNDLFLMETRETKTHFSQWFPPVWPNRGIPWESWHPEDSENVVFQKKRHGHNIDFWGLKRIARTSNMVGTTCYSFQTSKIEIELVSF